MFAPENVVSRDGFGSSVPREPAHLHTQDESGAHLRDSSRVPQRRPSIYLIPPYAIGSVPSLSGHANAYRWRSLSRVRRHRASKPQCSSERVLPWQVTMDQLIYASLSQIEAWLFRNFEMFSKHIDLLALGRKKSAPVSSSRLLQDHSLAHY